MSLVISCITKEGIFICADGKAMGWKPDGEPIVVQVNPVVFINNRALIVAGGVPESVEMATKCAKFLADEGIADVVEMNSAVLAFLAGEYDVFMRKKCEIMPFEPTFSVYFLLGGWSEKEKRYCMYFMWTKKKLPSLDSEEIKSVFCMPRVMSIEAKLSSMVKSGASLEDIVKLVKDRVPSLEQLGDDIGPPWSYFILKQDKIEKIS